jgi:hypothetical protein
MTSNLAIYDRHILSWDESYSIPVMRHFLSVTCCFEFGSDLKLKQASPDLQNDRIDKKDKPFDWLEKGKKEIRVGTTNRIQKSLPIQPGTAGHAPMKSNQSISYRLWDNLSNTYTTTHHMPPFCRFITQLSLDALSCDMPSKRIMSYNMTHSSPITWCLITSHISSL